MKQYQKIVLAYSGGLDTSVIIPWLKPRNEYILSLHDKIWFMCYIYKAQN